MLRAARCRDLKGANVLLTADGVAKIGCDACIVCTARKESRAYLQDQNLWQECRMLLAVLQCLSACARRTHARCRRRDVGLAKLIHNVEESSINAVGNFAYARCPCFHECLLAPGARA